MLKGFDFRVIFIVLVNWKILVEKRDGELIDLMMNCYSKVIFFLFIFIVWKINMDMYIYNIRVVIFMILKC